MRISVGVSSGLACVFALAGCASTVTSTEPGAVASEERDEVIQGPYVPAGTRFSAHLDTDIDTARTAAGQPFEAHVDEPLRTTMGQVLVPGGATVRGVVAASEDGRLRLTFQSVDTVAGPVPLRASVRHAEHYAYRGARPAGGGPGQPGTEAQRAHEVRLPRGSQLQLVLTRPLLAPTASVLHLR